MHSAELKCVCEFSQDVDIECIRVTEIVSDHGLVEFRCVSEEIGKGFGVRWIGSEPGFLEVIQSLLLISIEMTPGDEYLPLLHLPEPQKIDPGLDVVPSDSVLPERPEFGDLDRIWSRGAGVVFSIDVISDVVKNNGQAFKRLNLSACQVGTCWEGILAEKLACFLEDVPKAGVGVVVDIGLHGEVGLPAEVDDGLDSDLLELGGAPWSGNLEEDEGEEGLELETHRAVTRTRLLGRKEWMKGK